MDLYVVDVLSTHSGKSSDAIISDPAIKSKVARLNVKLMVWASPKVLQLYREMKGSPSALVIMDEMVREMRRDLGI